MYKRKDAVEEVGSEEIEADIVHYSEKNIIFFVYDKYKIIKERQSYEEKYFNRTFDGKNVKIVIHQPVKLWKYITHRSASRSI